MASWRVGIDVGGTFTDLVAVDEQRGEYVHLKVPSTPEAPSRGFIDALNAVCERTGLDGGVIRSIFHGTTLATNAILERELSPTALVTTRGFRDVLEIGRHWRSHLYDLDLERPPTLVPRPLRLEVGERIDHEGTVIEAPDQRSIDSVIETILAASVESVAVVFLHSYANDAHERMFLERMRALGVDERLHVSLSSQVSPEPREYERTATTVLNAALMPLVDDYLTSLERELGGNGSAPSLYLIQSNGGALAPATARRRPVRLAQSGPVAGVRSCVAVGEALGYPNVIGLDMGGTSADIALVRAGQPRLTTELQIGELPVRLPSVQVHSIGAGGGSIAWLDEVGALHLGPQSAGAVPGPACYRRGGVEPTVTDSHLTLGRLSHQRPLAGFLTLDEAAARTALDRIAQPLGISVEEAALGVLEVVNAEMEAAIRVVLRERGDDPRDFALIAYGGAGPLHAVELAARLSIETVIVPEHPGTFSALGLLTSELRQDFSISRPIRADDPDAVTRLARAFAELEALAARELGDDPDFSTELVRERRCDVRYLGQAYEVSVPVALDLDDPRVLERLVADFHAAHEQRYAFANPEDPCEVRTQRLFVSAPVEPVRAARRVTRSSRDELRRVKVIDATGPIECVEYMRDSLAPGDELVSPCIVHQDDATTYIPPNVNARIAPTGDIVVSGIGSS